MRTVTEQVAALASGAVSPSEMVDRALAAIEAVARTTNAFTHVLDEDAVRTAAGMTRAPGPLHGLPVAVKDLFDVAGAPTSGCTEPYRGRLASRDSAVVEALRAAGAIVVAKTNQHELAVGATTRISCFGPVANPWRPSAIAGGSSGGSGAAVAAGAVAMAVGSDTGGSIRIPASFCGVTGLKPTHGAVSLRGAMPLAPTLDTAGPLAVSAADCRLVFDVLAGFDPDDPYSRSAPASRPPASVRGLRLALPASFLRLASAETRAAVEAAARTFEALGPIVDETEGPDADLAWTAGGPSMMIEFAHHYRDLWDDERVSPEPAALLAYGRSATAVDHVEQLEARRAVVRNFEWALTAADALLLPAAPYAAPDADVQEVEVGTGMLDVHAGGPARCTIPVNLAGLPSLAFPVGRSADGLPLGAQLVGAPWTEDLLCMLGEAYQEATDWHLAVPAS